MVHGRTALLSIVAFMVAATALVRKHMGRGSVSTRRQDVPGRCRESTPFLREQGQLVLVEYRWDRRWYIAKIRSCDVNGTFTVMFEDGSLQIGTRPHQFSRDGAREILLARGHELYVDPSSAMSDAAAEERALLENGGDTIWHAARRGDVVAVAFFVSGDARLLNMAEQDGRTPLYWACLCGNVDTVRYLLGAGARDWDGSAYIAVTSHEAGDNNVDLVFDPDEGLYSDYVDYEEAAGVKEQPGASKAIRDLLRAHRPPTIPGRHQHIARTTTLPAASTSAHTHTASYPTVRFPSSQLMAQFQPTLVDQRTTALHTPLACHQSLGPAAPQPAPVHAGDMPLSGGVRIQQRGGPLPAGLAAALPSAVYLEHGARECGVCMERLVDAVCSPCGHAVACEACITKCRDLRQGCPVCRGRIREVLHLTVKRGVQGDATTVAGSAC